VNAPNDLRRQGRKPVQITVHITGKPCQDAIEAWAELILHMELSRPALKVVKTDRKRVTLTVP